jgi:sugar transferase EpsL
VSHFYRRYGKRLFDLLLTIPALVVFTPLMALVALVVRLKLGSPVLFRQKRPGLHGEPFTLFKFRTMTDGRDEAGNLLPEAIRLTRLGRLLRSTSLDELPELWNVLRGEMSLVGPRPLLMEYLPHYSVREFARHNALPGITGLAQVSGRNNLPWDQRFEMDLYYVENCRLGLDIMILLKTVLNVLRAKDVAAPRTENLLSRQREQSDP